MAKRKKKKEKRKIAFTKMMAYKMTTTLLFFYTPRVPGSYLLMQGHLVRIYDMHTTMPIIVRRVYHGPRLQHVICQPCHVLLIIRLIPH